MNPGFKFGGTPGFQGMAGLITKNNPTYQLLDTVVITAKASEFRFHAYIAALAPTDGCLSSDSGCPMHVSEFLSRYRLFPY